jgi:hypothetical protein
MSVQPYLKQLLSDIEYSTRNANFNLSEKSYHQEFWIQEGDEISLSLCACTGIQKEMLPPAHMLDEPELSILLQALKRMLAAYNCHFVLQMEVPEEFQYETIRQHLDQKIKRSKSRIGFFERCTPGTRYEKCTLGDYCHCAFFEKFVAGTSAVK